MSFNVLMAVYHRDNPHHFAGALESVRSNTLLPKSVVIVADGPLTSELEKILNEYSFKMNLNVIRLKTNLGLGNALNIGLAACDEKYVARFDSDDICDKFRFEKQINFLEQNKDISIISSWISEFNISPNNNAFLKKVPQSHESILKCAKLRNPFNHMAVVFKKADVIAAGGYRNEFLYEDYSLWVRMLLNGVKASNIPEVLVHARIGNGMIARRGGLRYAISEVMVQKNFWDMNFLTFFEFIRNVCLRVPVRLVHPKIRSFIYWNFLRKS